MVHQTIYPIGDLITLHYQAIKYVLVNVFHVARFQTLLTRAYTLQSWICGKIIQLFDPEAIALVSSKGYETPLSKFLMRMTVVIADVLGTTVSILRFLCIALFTYSCIHSSVLARLCGVCPCLLPLRPAKDDCLFSNHGAESSTDYHRPWAFSI